MGTEYKSFSIKILRDLTEDVKYVRETVFRVEQGFENEFDEIDSVAEHLLMLDNASPVATCRIFKEDREDEFVLGRLAVLKKYRGKHVGSDLLNKAEEHAKSRGAKAIRLHSQCAARKFYESNGYVAYGEVEYEEGVPHIWMRKTLDK